MKYIFITGAPGSKWSSINRYLYWSPSVDRSDFREQWKTHIGTYFDPGMNCHLPENFHKLSKKELEDIFDSPFSSNSVGIKIIKSHIFSNQIDFLKTTFFDVPIVLVHRSDDECLGAWIRTGNFNIPYPNYLPYYKNFKKMAELIASQNRDLLEAWNKYPGLCPRTNAQLATMLGIDLPTTVTNLQYKKLGIKVKII